LVRRPAVVHEAGCRPWPVVDLLPRVLADITDVEIAVGPIEREAPRVPQPVGVDLPVPPVQTQQLAQLAGEILRVVRWVAAGAAVARARVEPAVRPELELAAVVVVVRTVVDYEQLPPRGRKRAAAPREERVDLDIAGLVRVVDVKAVILRVHGIERDREQTLLGVATLDPVVNVEEGAPLPVRKRHDSPGPLDDVEAAGLALRLRYV